MKTFIVFTQAYRLLFPLTALFTAISVVYWLAGLSGMLTLRAQPTLWHAHEMLFGFAMAIIAGFVLTAAANWTRLPVASPRALIGLAGIWVIARLSAFIPTPWASTPGALIDSLFLPGVAILITRVLLKSGNRRNYMFIPFLWGLAAVNIAFHFMIYEQSYTAARLLITFTAYLIGFLMVFMGGRVIPFFTANRCHYQPIQWPWLNWLATLGALFSSLLIISQPMATWTASLAGITGLAILLRLTLWQPWRVWRIPLLWILHIGYAWLGVAFLLAAAVNGGWIPFSTLPIHALMAGALGCLGMGMMTRVALGHSGRPLVSNPILQAAFVLVVMAGVFRLASYYPGPLQGLEGLTYSAITWSLAFLIYFLVFASLLWFRHRRQDLEQTDR